jgi:predicted flap endonuclease-1-like 5' DNA nuclease
MADPRLEGATNGERPSDKPSSERVLAAKAVSGVVASFDPGLLPFRPIASSELVKIGERVGVFTPIADAKDPGSEGNLEKVVEALRQRVTELENENLELRRALEDQEKERTRTPDDFATAVAHTLDSLQSRLSETKNAVSRFAVREMAIEAQVFVDVNRLGALEYRFIKPGDKVAPEQISRLKLDLVPLPREDAAGVLAAPHFTPFVGIDEVQGIGEKYRAHLNARQIYTVSDLVAAGTRARSKVELAALLDVGREQLGEWIAQAELLTVRDLDGPHAELLVQAGITSLAVLAALSPEEIVERHEKARAEAKRTSAKPISVELATSWRAAALRFEGNPPKA